jgi:hypothetical protein
MTTTCQTILDRARALSALNPSVMSDRAEMLSRISADQQELFTRVNAATPDFFQTFASVTSNVATTRQFDLGAAFIALSNAPVERVLKLYSADGTEYSRVEVQDLDAELAPRYFQRAQRLLEPVAGEWGAAGAVTATLVYAYGPTAIDTAGALSQAVSVPDAWVDLLVLPLGIYAHAKDPGRDSEEAQRWAQVLGSWGDGDKAPSGRRGAFLTYVASFGGDQLVRRFDR